MARAGMTGRAGIARSPATIVSPDRRLREENRGNRIPYGACREGCASCADAVKGIGRMHSRCARIGRAMLVNPYPRVYNDALFRRSPLIHRLPGHGNQ